MGETCPSEQHLRSCMLMQFHMKKKATDATKDICNIYGEILDIRECQRWYKKFKSGNINLNNEPGSVQLSKADEKALKTDIVTNQEMTIEELSKEVSSSLSNTQRCLKETGKIWVPHSSDHNKYSFAQLKKVQANETSEKVMKKKRPNSVCECCLSMKNLSQISDEWVNLIALCFSVHIVTDLPAENFQIFICNNCELKIKDCFEFRCQILNCQNKLKLIRNSSNSSTDFKNESGGKNYFCDDFVKLKEEFVSEIDDTEDSSDLTTGNQNNDGIELKLSGETFDCDVKNKINSNSKLKKMKSSTERTRRYRMRKKLANKSQAKLNLSQVVLCVDTPTSYFPEQNVDHELTTSVKKSLKTSTEHTRNRIQKKSLKKSQTEVNLPQVMLCVESPTPYIPEKNDVESDHNVVVKKKKTSTEQTQSYRIRKKVANKTSTQSNLSNESPLIDTVPVFPS